MKNNLQLQLYRQLLKTRMVEEKMLILLRQNKIGKWFSSIGQEAISVGCAAALSSEEVIFTMHRNLGVFVSRQVPLHALMSQWEGKTSGFTKGRDRSFHFGALDYGIVGMISHLGPQLSLAAGMALAHKLKDEKRIALAFTGEGATSEGEFHEALNVAAVWQLPVIFVIENNGYGLSTTTSEQYRCTQLADRGIGYGIEAVTIDGNNVLEVYETVHQFAASMRENPRPILIECMTFRMRGHEEASGTKYVPKELMDFWATKDPLHTFEKSLLLQNLLSEKEIENFRNEFLEEINHAVELSEQESQVASSPEEELNDVYFPYQQITKNADNQSVVSEKRYINAISDGLRQAMERYPELVLMGQDIAEYGGAYKITEGFVHQFGKARVRNTPLCESAIIGIALGLSLHNMKAMVEMQFADFVSCAFNQIINNLAKTHYRWGAKADVVIRMPTGGTTGAGPFHSQSNEAWFVHTPGLKVVYPSNPYDAKGLLLASFEDPNPILFFEHKALYRSLSAAIPDDYYTVEIGKAKLIKEGTQATIITYGMGVQWALKTIENTNINADIIDLRTLLPIDYQTISESVKKTNRAIILHEDTLIGGIGGEISAYLSEHLFEYLDAPVMRCASLDTPVPFSKALENNFMADARFAAMLQKLIEY